MFSPDIKSNEAIVKESFSQYTLMDSVYCTKDWQLTPNMKGMRQLASQRMGERFFRLNVQFAAKPKCNSFQITRDLLMSGTEFAIQKGVPFLAKTTVEASRYYASEAKRNKKLQQKAISYGIKIA